MIFLGIALFLMGLGYWDYYRRDTTDRNAFDTSLVITAFFLIWFVACFPSLSTMAVILLMVYLCQNQPDLIDALKTAVDKKIPKIDSTEI